LFQLSNTGLGKGGDLLIFMPVKESLEVCASRAILALNTIYTAHFLTFVHDIKDQIIFYPFHISLFYLHCIFILGLLLRSPPFSILNPMHITRAYLIRKNK
jgi:hypothetical protein